MLEVGISVGAAAATFGLTWFAYFVVKGLEMLRLTGEFGELLGSVLPLLAVASVILPSLFLKGFSSVFRALPVAALVAAVGSIIVWQLSKS